MFENLSLKRTTTDILKALRPFTAEVLQSDVKRVYVVLKDGTLVKISRSPEAHENRAEAAAWERVKNTDWRVLFEPVEFISSNGRILTMRHKPTLTEADPEYLEYEYTARTDFGLYLTMPESTTTDYTQIHYPYVYKENYASNR